MVCFKQVGLHLDSLGSGYALAGSTADPQNFDLVQMQAKLSPGVTVGFGPCAADLDWFIGWNYDRRDVVPGRHAPYTQYINTVSLGVGRWRPGSALLKIPYDVRGGIRDQTALDLDLTSGDKPSVSLLAQTRRTFATQIILQSVGLRVGVALLFRTRLATSHEADDGAHPAWEFRIGIDLAADLLHGVVDDAPGIAQGINDSIGLGVGMLQLFTMVRALHFASATIEKNLYLLGWTSGLVLVPPLYSEHDGLIAAVGENNSAGLGVVLGADIALLAAHGVAARFAGDVDNRAGHFGLAMLSSNFVVEDTLRVISPRVHDDYGVVVRTVTSCLEFGVSFAVSRDYQAGLQLPGGQCATELLLKPLGQWMGLIPAQEPTVWQVLAR